MQEKDLSLKQVVTASLYSEMRVIKVWLVSQYVWHVTIGVTVVVTVGVTVGVACDSRCDSRCGM